MSEPAAEQVLRYWFGARPGYGTAASHRRWFGASPRTDREIGRRFGPMVAQALRGPPPGWPDTARTRLAQVLLLDQFTRNLFRGTARAFDGDPRARELARATLDAPLAPIERAFLYMPFEHSESLADQELGLRLFEALQQAVPPSARAMFDSFLAHAEEHCALIRRFGRFPHRNAALGRESSAEEARYLASGGRRFGQ